MKRQKGNFLNYNKLKGRLTIADIAAIAIVIGIIIIDTKSLHSLNLNVRDGVVGKYLDLMSIFVFVYGTMFLIYGWFAAYDAITFMTSKHAYAPKYIFITMIALAILQILAGIDTLGRLFEMNGLLVSRNQNVFSGLYLFKSAIKGVVYSLLMYVVRMISDGIIKYKHEKLMQNNQDMRDRRERLEKMFNDN